MTLEHLFTDRIEEHKQLALHPEATHFSCRSGRFRQFKVNPNPNKNMVEIPKGAVTCEFKGYRSHGAAIFNMEKLSFILQEGRF